MKNILRNINSDNVDLGFIIRVGHNIKLEIEEKLDNLYSGFNENLVEVELGISNILLKIYNELEKSSYSKYMKRKTINNCRAIRTGYCIDKIKYYLGKTNLMCFYEKINNLINDRDLYISRRSSYIVEFFNYFFPMGSSYINFDNWVSDKLKRDINNIVKYIPNKWWDYINNGGLRVDTCYGDRSYYEKPDKYERFNDIIYLDNKYNNQDILHEIGHMLDYRIPILRLLCDKYFNKRIYGCPLEFYSKYNKELCFKYSGFCHLYMGKFYESGDNEILSYCLDNLYLDSFDMWSKDPQSIDFILGLMFLF